MYTRFAKHHITDAAAIPFDPAVYSRFKYGDGAVAQQYGEELAEAFIDAHRDLLLGHEDIVLVPSPYDAIPTASYAMAMAFRKALNVFLYEAGKKSLLTSKIHRYKTYTEDYGAMSSEQRLALISSDTYHLDAAFLANRLVLFLDDIRITGSHELIIRRQIEREKIGGHFLFLYYALLDNEAIAPNFENYLNYYDVAGMERVVELFNGPHFLMNTRVVKYILKSAPEAVQQFLASADPARVHELAGYAIGNNYHLMDDYKVALTHIIQSTHYGNQSPKRTARSHQRA